MAVGTRASTWHISSTPAVDTHASASKAATPNAAHVLRTVVVSTSVASPALILTIALGTGSVVVRVPNAGCTVIPLEDGHRAPENTVVSITTSGAITLGGFVTVFATGYTE